MSDKTFSDFIEKKWTGIFLLVLACLYIVSPYDVLPEAVYKNAWAYSDDILAFVLACVKSYNMGKKGGVSDA